MTEVRFAVGDADAGLAERLDEELTAFGECGRTPGYPHGQDDIHLVRQLY
jgi:hypothetical protein